MLSYLKEDMISNFYTCDNIVNAGKKGYGITKVTFFLHSENRYEEYVSFTVNWCNELIVYTNTEDTLFLNEIYEEIKEEYAHYNEVSFATPYSAIFDSDDFNKRFVVKEKNNSEYGVYAMHSKNELKTVSAPENVSVKLYHKSETKEFESYNSNLWQGLDNMIKYGQNSDILFVIRENDTVCGYLDANITYENIYDIANVFVLPEYRGKKYGTILTAEYAKYCYNNSFIPHYGTAVSVFSEKVATNCGFKETSRTNYAKIGLK
jgi:GNAT superfamily N-acetyltransferase